MRWEIPRQPDRPAARATAAECGNCKIPVDEACVERQGRTFCCDGCADGGPCLC